MNCPGKLPLRLAAIIAPALLTSTAWGAPSSRPPASDNPVQMQEYLFEVPVRIKNVDPRLTTGLVRCEIRAVFEQTRFDTAADRVHEFFGAESAPFTLRNGGFDGKVPVRVVVTKNIKGEADYACMLHLRVADGQDAVKCALKNEKSGSHELTCDVAPWASIEEGASEMIVGDQLPLPKR